MAFQLVIHGSDGDFVLGSYDTRTAAEKIAAISIAPGDRWSIVEIAEKAHPADVVDFGAYRATRRARHSKK